MRAAHCPHSCRAQRGAALLLAMFIIGLAVTALVVRSYDAAEMKARQEEKTMKALAEAKAALIAWSVAHKDSPGQMPWPDRRETSNPNYDGSSDCSSSSFDLVSQQGEAKFLGQLPSLPSTTPCLVYPGVGRYQDAYGNNLWYAVSRNLVRRYDSPATNPVINPGIITTPNYSWMVVRDSQGRIISNRVAAVIIAPGSPLLGQNRSSNTPPASAYLDTIEIDGVIYSNSDYQADNKSFIQAEEGSSFNDRLVYITIDELISALEKRVVREVRNLNFTPDMVRCTLSGCVKEPKGLKWSSAGVYVTSGSIDATYYHKPDIAQDFNCQWRELQNTIRMDCKTLMPDSKENILRIITPSYPFILDRLTGHDVIRVLDENGVEKGTIGPADNSYFTVSSENPINHIGWPQWYFSNKWDEYIYVVAEEFNANNEGTCNPSSSCLILNWHGQEVTGIKQLVFSRAWSNLEKLAKGEATNYFDGVSKYYGDVAWKQ
ncbi:hypothetical protein IHQ56_13950 [Methylobacillus flagellatus]|uniref:hypothetical protein n=1 Tax=Methylobacillus flagellatus TaxID=405 RepID=UPI002853F221|nr:hypothetical protein [Methylobacillus flagellatus]MDR5172922.1 hypothetical protein [Methylobacillus flagellatus]